MRLIIYSETNASNIHENLGKSEYSYYFVLKKYLPILEHIAELTYVEDPATEVDPLYEEFLASGENAVFLSFSPPHKTELDLKCPTVCVLAWEFSTIPNETWDDNPKNNWVESIERIGNIITISDYSTAVIKSQVNESVNVCTIPAPVTDETPDSYITGMFRKFLRILPGGALRDKVVRENRTLNLSATVIDTTDLIIEDDIVRSKNTGEIGPNVADIPPWDNQPIEMCFKRASRDDEVYRDLVGFYEPEDWGTWSRTAQPWILLPVKIDGCFLLSMTLVAFVDHGEDQITVSVGDKSRIIAVGSELTRYDLEFADVSDGTSIKFSGVKVGYTVATKDFRAFGLGVGEITILRLDESGQNIDAEIAPLPPPHNADTPKPAPGPESDRRVSTLKLNGLVYTTMFNPSDGRKNWEDIITAFCWAFREEADRTLILKMTNTSTSTFLGPFLVLLSQLNPFKCRIVTVQGYLSSDEMASLVEVTDYFVNASSAEGQCLPLLEFMARGVPAIAPDHTAMASYIDESDAFVVDSSIAVTSWPQDPRNRARTFLYRIDWCSLKNAYSRSARLALESPRLYTRLADKAKLIAVQKFSIKTVERELREYLSKF